MSATISLFHIIINTLGREMTTPDETSEHMYRYISAIIKSKNCRLFRINGIGNHIHLLVGLSPSTALSDFVRDIKQGSSKWAKQQAYFPNFRGWSKEYGAFSCSVRDKDSIINYINNQWVHHRQKSFEQEYQDMIHRSGLEWNEYRLTSYNCSSRSSSSTHLSTAVILTKRRPFPRARMVFNTTQGLRPYRPLQGLIQ